MSDPVAEMKSNIGLQIMELFGLFCAGFLILAALTAVIPMMTGGENTHSSFLLISTLQNLIVFCFPAWLTARISTKQAARWLHIDTIPPAKAFAGVVLLYIIALPALNQIIFWNANVHLPEWASGIEERIRQLEDQAEGVTKLILDFNSVQGMIMTVLVVGVLTGFSEEIFFRGALQNILERSRLGSCGAIWVSAIVFTTLHFQFFGFIPRLLIGAMFGYLLVWSRSLWLPVFAHVLNNSMVVAVAGISGTEGDEINSLGVNENGGLPVAAIASGLATAVFLWRFRRYFFYKMLK